MVDYTKDWEEKSLEELCVVITKQTGFDYTSYIKDNLKKNRNITDIPFIQNKDFNKKWINFNTDYYIPKNIAKKFPKIFLNEKTLLISISGKIGNVGIYDLEDEAFIGGAVCVLKFKNKDNIDWVMYYLISPLGQKILKGNEKSSSHKNLVLGDIRKIYVPIPEFTEQQAIVAVLSDFDDYIVNLEKLIEKKKAIRDGTLKELVTGKKRLPGFNREWRKTTLNKIGDVQMCRRVFSNQTIKKKDIPFYKIGTFGLEADTFISKKLFYEYRDNYPYPEQGDSLISASGSIGKVVQFKGEKAYFQDSNIVWLKINNQLQEQINKDYLYYFFKSYPWNFTEGTTISRLYNNIILATNFNFPIDIVEQEAIADILTEMDKEIENLENEKVKVEQLRDGTMDDLLTGKMRLVKRKEEYFWQQIKNASCKIKL